MGRRGRELGVTSAVRSQDGSTPEAPSYVRGSRDLWPVVRDHGSPAAVRRGELDPMLDELHHLARSQDVLPLTQAVEARRAELASVPRGTG